jgi:hypothetical protein
MKAYGDITGNLVEVKQDPAMEAIAGIDDEKQEVRILIGRGGSHLVADNDVLKIRSLDEVSWLSGLDSVYVVAKQIPYLGWKALPSPISIIDGNVEVRQNVVRLSFTETSHYDAIEVVLKVPQN